MGRGKCQLILLLGHFFVSVHSGQDSFQLSHFTNYFRSTPEGYDQKWNPEASRNFDSEIHVSINPGCNIDGCKLKNGTVGVTVANLTVLDDPSQHHEFHWVWSVIGHPVIQAAVTAKDSIAHVDWSAIFGMASAGHAISYDEEPYYSSAIMMTRLIEFNDTANTGKMDSKENLKHIRTYDLVNFDWKRVVVENSKDRVAIQLITDKYTPNRSLTRGEVGEGVAEKVDDSQLAMVTNGTLNLTLSGYSDDGFGRWLPHLSHSRRTNQFDIQLEGLKTNSGFNCSRYALEFVFVSNVPKDRYGTNVTRQKTTTLDDEHTPGIFTTEELIMPGLNDSLKSYMQWRPIVYTTMGRELSSSTGVHVMEPSDVKDPASSLDKTIMYILYGMDLDEVVVKSLNISFGIPGDGFYNKTRFHAWTFTFGTGDPIRNGLSSSIIITIIALVLVTLVTIAVALGFCIHNKVKVRQTNQGYARMNGSSSANN